MKETVFKGVATAIVTPMTEKGVDYESFERLIEWQIAEGINAIVVAGTTGEGSTLSDQEHKDVLKFAVACNIRHDQMVVIIDYRKRACAFVIKLFRKLCGKKKIGVHSLPPF